MRKKEIRKKKIKKRRKMRGESWGMRVEK